MPNDLTSNWPIIPMEPVSCPDIFDSPEHLYQVKWDGVRCLSYIELDGIRLYNRKLNERTKQFPEIIKALKGMPKGTVLDGEVVAIGDSGKPDFYRVLKRDQIRKTAKIPSILQAYPVDYMVFDVLHYKGNSTMEWPLTERLKLLGDIMVDRERLHRVDSVMEQGSALFDAVKAEQLEGVVAKELSSRYIPGQKTPHWKKIKAWRELDTLIGGYLEREGQLRSLLVGLQLDDGLQYVGSVSSGLNEDWRSVLLTFFKSIRRPSPPFVNPPVKPGSHWVEPKLGVKVRYLEWSHDGSLRNPSIVEFNEP